MQRTLITDLPPTCEALTGGSWVSFRVCLTPVSPTSGWVAGGAHSRAWAHIIGPRCEQQNPERWGLSLREHMLSFPPNSPCSLVLDIIISRGQVLGYIALGQTNRKAASPLQAQAEGPSWPQRPRPGGSGSSILCAGFARGRRGSAGGFQSAGDCRNFRES